MPAGLGADRVESLCDIATGGVWPDLTLFLRLHPEVAAERIAAEGRAADRFEGEGIELQRRVAEGYEEVAARHPERFRVIDASGDPDEVHAAVRRRPVRAGARRRSSMAIARPRCRPPSPRRRDTSPRAGAALGAALAAARPTPTSSAARAGSGKRAAARAFAAELLAAGAPDPDDARRRALLDPSPHPDLVWLRPPGAQHLVDECASR